MHGSTGYRRATRSVAWALLIAGGLSGCDSLLDVSLPGSTPADAMDDPTYSELLVISAQGMFECSYSNYAFIAGHLGGELIGAQSSLSTQPYQRRDVLPIHSEFGQSDCEGPVGLYTPLSTARFMADDAITRITAFTDAQVANRNRLLGRAALYAGFSYTVFADAFCTATFDVGPELQPLEVYELAKKRFTSAIEYATLAGDAETLNTALVGRARVLLAMGDLAGARADAVLVPEGFVKMVTRSNASNGRQNDIFVQNVRSRAHSIDPHFWSVTWMGTPDPRVRVTNTGTKGIDGLTDLWTQSKFTSEATGIRLASYTEAQLIIAEIDGGETAVDIINALHAAVGIPGFESSDPVEIRNQVIEERRREFFLEGRRFADLRRYGGLEEAAGGKHPFLGNDYGLTSCLPLPNVEIVNNPNIIRG